MLSASSQYQEQPKAMHTQNPFRKPLADVQMALVGSLKVPKASKSSPLYTVRGERLPSNLKSEHVYLPTIRPAIAAALGISIAQV